MSTIQFNDIDDAVLCTQENFINKGSFLDMQTDLADHVAVREMWKKRKKVFSGGHPWTFKAQIDHNHSAKAVGLFETDGSALTDTMIGGSIPVRHVNAHYIYDQREPDFQRGGSSIVDLVRTRYVGMMISLFERIEEYLWGVPDAGDEKTPFGLKYWLLRNTSEGFNGENHANFSSGRANIDSTTYTRWANWSNDYEEITKPDLIRSMRRAHRKIQFRSPVSHAQPVVGGMGNGIYTNDAVLGIMEEILEDQNMNLGLDLASKDGKTLFKSTPIVYAPFLDDDSENPVYMLDWKYLAIGVMAGWENNLGKPYMVPNKHLVRRVDLDASLNMISTNLRRQAVFYDPA